VPDFADRKKTDRAEKKVPAPAEYQPKPQAVRSLAGDGPSAVSKKEGAREAFARINYNIQSGFKKLEDRLNTPPTKTKDSGLGHNTFNYEYNTNSYTSVNNAGDKKPEWKASAPASVRAGYKSGLVAPSKAVGPTVRSIESGVRSPVGKATDFPAQRAAHAPVTGAAQPPRSNVQVSAAAPPAVAPVADQRAHQNFARGEAHKVEADATRMARVLEADNRIRRGDLPESPKVQSWASAIRGGRQREVADIQPQAVQKTVEKLTGGEQGAKQLNTPQVAQIEAEHRSRAQTLQHGLDSKRSAQAATPAAEAPRAKDTSPRSLEAPRAKDTSPRSLEAPRAKDTSPRPPDAPRAKEMAIRSVESSPSRPEKVSDRGFPSSRPGAAAPVQSSIQDHEMTAMLRNNDLTHSGSAVESIGSMKGSSAEQPGAEGFEQPEIAKLERLDKPKIGSVSTTQQAPKSAGAQPIKMGKAPWGENREIGNVADLLRDLLNETKKGGG